MMGDASLAVWLENVVGNDFFLSVVIGPSVGEISLISAQTLVHLPEQGLKGVLPAFEP